MKTKQDKLSVAFTACKEDGKQWSKPQAAAKEMIAAIGKLAKDVEADGRKLGKVSVKMTIDLGIPECVFAGTVAEA